MGGEEWELVMTWSQFYENQRHFRDKAMHILPISERHGWVTF